MMNDLIVDASRDPEVRGAALKITAGAKSGYYMNEAELLFKYVKDQIRYTGDPTGEDVFQYPLLTLKNRAGDCNNRAVLFAALARSIGFPVRMVFVFKDQQSADAARAGDVNAYPVHVYIQIDVTKEETGKPRWLNAETTPAPSAMISEPQVFLTLGDKFPGGASLISEVTP